MEFLPVQLAHTMPPRGSNTVRSGAMPLAIGAFAVKFGQALAGMFALGRVGDSAPPALLTQAKTGSILQNNPVATTLVMPDVQISNRLAPSLSPPANSVSTVAEPSVKPQGTRAEIPIDVAPEPVSKGAPSPHVIRCDAAIQTLLRELGRAMGNRPQARAPSSLIWALKESGEVESVLPPLVPTTGSQSSSITKNYESQRPVEMEPATGQAILEPASATANPSAPDRPSELKIPSASTSPPEPTIRKLTSALGPESPRPPAPARVFKTHPNPPNPIGFRTAAISKTAPETIQPIPVQKAQAQVTAVQSTANNIIPIQATPVQAVLLQVIPIQNTPAKNAPYPSRYKDNPVASKSPHATSLAQSIQAARGSRPDELATLTGQTPKAVNRPAAGTGNGLALSPDRDEGARAPSDMNAEPSIVAQPERAEFQSIIGNFSNVEIQMSANGVLPPSAASAPAAAMPSPASASIPVSGLQTAARPLELIQPPQSKNTGARASNESNSKAPIAIRIPSGVAGQYLPAPKPFAELPGPPPTPVQPQIVTTTQARPASTPNLIQDYRPPAFASTLQKNSDSIASAAQANAAPPSRVTNDIRPQSLASNSQTDSVLFASTTQANGAPAPHITRDFRPTAASALQKDPAAIQASAQPQLESSTADPGRRGAEPKSEAPVHVAKIAIVSSVAIPGQDSASTALPIHAPGQVTVHANQPTAPETAAAPKPMETLTAWQNYNEGTRKLVRSASLTESPGMAEMHVELQAGPLGPLQLHTVIHEGAVGAEIHVQGQEAHTLLSAGLPSLQRTLAEKNLQVQSIAVYHDGGAGGMSGFGRQNSQPDSPPPKYPAQWVGRLSSSENASIVPTAGQESNDLSIGLSVQA